MVQSPLPVPTFWPMRHKDASTELLGRCLLSLLVGQSLRLPTTPLPTLKIRTARSGPANQRHQHCLAAEPTCEPPNSKMLIVGETQWTICWSHIFCYLQPKQSFLLTFIKPDAIANLFLRLSFLRLELPVGFQTVYKRKKKVSLHSSWDHMPSKSIPLKVYPNFKEPLFMKSTLSIFIFWFVLFLF